MGIFQKISESISNRFQDKFEKRKEEREFEEKLRREQRLLDKIEFEKAFKISARKAAKLKAERDAGKFTGLAKLRAINRVKNLADPNQKPFFEKISEHINRNIARREANLKRTEEIKQAVNEERTGNKPGGKILPRTPYKPFSDLNRLSNI